MSSLSSLSLLCTAFLAYTGPLILISDHFLHQNLFSSTYFITFLLQVFLNIHWISLLFYSRKSIGLPCPASSGYIPLPYCRDSWLGVHRAPECKLLCTPANSTTALFQFPLELKVFEDWNFSLKTLLLVQAVVSLRGTSSLLRILWGTPCSPKLTSAVQWTSASLDVFVNDNLHQAI